MVSILNFSKTLFNYKIKNLFSPDILLNICFQVWTEAVKSQFICFGAVLVQTLHIGWITFTHLLQLRNTCRRHLWFHSTSGNFHFMDKRPWIYRIFFLPQEDLVLPRFWLWDKSHYQEDGFPSQSHKKWDSTLVNNLTDLVLVPCQECKEGWVCSILEKPEPESTFMQCFRYF